MERGLLSENEHISVMLNEERPYSDSMLIFRIAVIRGPQSANQIDNWIEKEVEYAICF